MKVSINLFKLSIFNTRIYFQCWDEIFYENNVNRFLMRNNLLRIFARTIFTITFFILLQPHFTFFRDSNKLRFVAGFANPVDIFSSHAETISFTGYHGVERNGDAEREAGFRDRCPPIFTGMIHLHGVTGDRATAIVR